MKKLIYILVASTCFYITSCISNKSEELSKTEELSKNFDQVIEATKEGANSPVSVIDLPLGLSIGMTPSQVDSVFSPLVESGEFENWKSQRYYFTYKIGNVSYDASLEYKFNNNQLYILQISSTPSANVNASVFDQVRNSLSQEYSSWKKIDYILYGSADDITNIWTDWFNNNMKIQLAYRFGDIDITYSNLPVSEAISQAQFEQMREEVRAEAAVGPAAKVENNSWDGSVRQVEKYLKNALKDPKSYESIEWSEVQKDGSNYKVRHKYRAKNSFGGYVISNQIFILNRQGEVINVIDL